MFCPNCKATLVCGDELSGYNDVVITETSNSEIEVVFSCDSCGEQYVVPIAQEDLIRDQS